MDMERHFFPGGNTSQGFYSRFASIMPKEDIKRKIILKGGPGVGKNTLMRRIAQTLRGMGTRMEYFHCASDPDSLDGIAAPEMGFVMVDGTAPHVIDPVLPGAVDGILNLGECLREESLTASRLQIRDTMEEISRCFLRVYDYLGAAAPLLAGSAREWREKTSPEVLARLCRALCDKWLPQGEGVGVERQLFSEAFTPKGQVSYLPTLLEKKVTCISSPWGLSPHPVLSGIKAEALRRGISVEGLYHPLIPGELCHLIFPTLNLSVVTGPVPRADETVMLQEELSLPQGLSREQAFDKNAYELLLLRAVESLKEVKERHDTLEKWYTAAMDYDKWEKALERTEETVRGMEKGQA